MLLTRDVTFSPVSDFCDKANLNVMMNSEVMVFQTEDGVEIGRALASSGLYHLSIVSDEQLNEPAESETELVAAVIDMDDPVMVWHRRLGHLGFESMRKLLKQSQGINLTDNQIKAKAKMILSSLRHHEGYCYYPKKSSTTTFQESR